MPEEAWAGVDRFLDGLYPPDDAHDKMLESARRADIPQIQVSPPLGRLLRTLATAIKARHALEIGTLAGYSAFWLARALPREGRLVTLEMDASHAALAHEHLEQTGLADRCEIIVGRALDTLPTLSTDYPNGFDLVFIDADKETYPQYWEWALKLTHPGSLIVADNVVRKGAVADPKDESPLAAGVRRYLELATTDPNVSTSVIQTVGDKGHDGIAISVILHPDHQ